jgi:MFS family permease
MGNALVFAVGGASIATLIGVIVTETNDEYKEKQGEILGYSALGGALLGGFLGVFLAPPGVNDIDMMEDMEFRQNPMWRAPRYRDPYDSQRPYEIPSVRY